MPSCAAVYIEYIRPLIAEFFGQLIFVFIHSCADNTISDSGGVPTGLEGNSLIPAIADGLTVAVLVITIGGISGAHVNFAVTIAVALGGEGFKLLMVPLYLISQLLGSLCGAGLALATNGEVSGRFVLADNVSEGEGLLMEGMLTAFLTFAVLKAAVELNTIVAAFAIGFTILVNILAGANVTGACMNPTLSFGPAVVSARPFRSFYYIYWVGPFLGAIFASILFRLLLGDKSRILFRRYSRSPPPTPLSPSDKMKQLPEENCIKISKIDVEAQIENELSCRL